MASLPISPFLFSGLFSGFIHRNQRLLSVVNQFFLAETKKSWQYLLPGISPPSPLPLPVLGLSHSRASPLQTRYQWRILPTNKSGYHLLRQSMVEVLWSNCNHVPYLYHWNTFGYFHMAEKKLWFFADGIVPVSPLFLRYIHIISFRDSSFLIRIENLSLPLVLPCCVIYTLSFPGLNSVGYTSIIDTSFIGGEL